MSFVDLPLPNRTIALTGRPVAAPAAMLFTVVLLSAMAIGLAIWQGPGLWRDWQISQNPLTMPTGEILDGECSTRRGLTDCEARLVYDYGGQSYDTHVSLAFVDFSSGDYEVDLVISRDKPELATVSLGLDMLWNRLAVFAVFMALFVGGPLAMFWGAYQASRANRTAAVPGRLTVVPVDVAGVDKKRNAQFVGYFAVKDGKRKGHITRTKFEDGQAPLMAVDEKGRLYGVAVKSENIALPVLLDSNLDRLELSDAERQLALASFDTQQEGRGAAAVVEKAKPSAGKRALRGLLAGGSVLVLMVIGIFGYWIYYATSAGDAFDSVGIEINNLMPEPLNSWACTQLYERFGDERAPYGCVAEDFTSWKVAASKTKN
ncbi:hypothetical protein SAMN05428969_1918 [Devosia sp. YR412]|uniref:hypothetical protein n=1 Tax=Devosia sp. YR412 TaxID=1881030 RepID=UPI0008C256BF|nr:hypothetical protein [Devosia sp. YR412]SEQ09140.1 hypothetical protein SAMN05428969_1918 [Devosia sp. YR412]